MADTWEQILHHTYAGTPGVIFDQSPGRRAHGVARDIPFNSYLPDGTETGSGVIDFRGGGVVTARIPDANPLRGLRVEIAVNGERHAQGSLINGDGFSLSVGTGFLNLYLRGTGPVPSDLVHVAPLQLDPAAWTTVGFLHDGVSTVFMTIDGAVVNQLDGYGLSSLRTVSIGNDANQTRPFGGLIDDVAIWRANPHRVNDEFFGHPMDEATKQCWLDWLSRLTDFAREDPDCVTRVMSLIRGAVDDLLARSSAQSDAVRREWQSVSQRYRERWQTGDLDSVGQVLVAHYDYLVSAGVDPMDSPAFVALRDDPCVQRMVETVGAATCDDDFTGEINRVINGVDGILHPTGPS